MVIRYECLDAAWADELEALELEVFSTIDPQDLYDAPELTRLAQTFPDGNFVAFDGDRAIGMGLGLLVDFDFDDHQHTLADITGDDGVSNHHPDHPWYYGTDISVLKEYRGAGVGKELYRLRQEFVRQHNKRGIVAGGVIPGYADHLAALSAADYVERVVAGELNDPTLSMQLRRGFEARGVLQNYVRDETVDNWSVLIVWDNPHYQDPNEGSP